MSKKKQNSGPELKERNLYRPERKQIKQTKRLAQSYQHNDSRIITINSLPKSYSNEQRKKN